MTETSKFLAKKKRVLDKLFKEYPGTEVLNLSSSKRKEPKQGFQILEVTQKNPDGSTKPWLSYKKGLKKYGIENLTLRRVLPDEIVLDCDNVNTHKVEERLIALKLAYEHWSTKPQTPYKKVHFRFRVPRLKDYTPNERWILKEGLIKLFIDKEGRTPDPCTAQKCRMISIEWSRHHKRNEYLQLIKKVSGKTWNLSQEWVERTLEDNKKLIEQKGLKEDRELGVKVRWLCPAKNYIIEKGRVESGRHRAALVVAAHCNNLGYSKEKALEFLRKWNEKNVSRSSDRSLQDQVNFVYEKDMKHLSCGWIKRQEDFCNRKNCEFEMMNKEAFKTVMNFPKEFEREIEKEFEDSKIKKTTTWKDEMKLIVHYLNFRDLAEQFYKTQPYFYDKARLWWMWDKKIKYWERVDEIDVMNAIDIALASTNLVTTKSQVKGEILEGLKRVGRLNLPEEMKKTWIQIGGTIIDIETDEEIESTPEYFATNPILREIGKTEDTPTIDKIFGEWVGTDYVQTLYEIIAYCLLPDYPIGRIFCLIGSGLNGKTCFLNLITQLIGIKNCCSAGLDRIINGRFESAKLYKKLLCTMGETNFATLKRTSMLKKLSGDDMIPFEFKNKDGFDGWNYAKILISTNSLPMTSDRTKGFYRRWLLIDFPNEFTEEIAILSTIPEQEYDNLIRKVIRILKELLKERKFTNEGSVEDRRKRYESVSNPVMTFIQKYCVKDVNGQILFPDFQEKLVKFLTKKGYRNMNATEIGMALSREGYVRRGRSVMNEDGVGKTTKYFIFGLSWEFPQKKKKKGVEKYA